MCTYTPNMKFLYLTLLLGGLYTDNADVDANNDAGRRKKHDCIRLFG